MTVAQRLFIYFSFQQHFFDHVVWATPRFEAPGVGVLITREKNDAAQSQCVTEVILAVDPGRNHHGLATHMYIPTADPLFCVADFPRSFAVCV